MESGNSQPPDARSQFSLRKLLLICGLLCIAAAWLGNEFRWADREALAKWRVREFGGKTMSAEIGIVYFAAEYVSLAGTSVKDTDLVLLTDFRSPLTIDLSNTAITDAGLKHLFGLTSLCRVILTGTEISPAGMQELKKQLPNCINKLDGP